MDEPKGRSGVIVAPRVFVQPEAAEEQAQARPLGAAASARAGVQRAAARPTLLAAAIGLRAAYVVAALALFVLSLELLKTGASGVKPVLEGISAEGTTGLLGFGWLGAYLVMSGSPVAAIALALYGGAALSDIETFAMLNGSRLGASFIVLFVGFLYYIARRRDPDSIYIGVVALLTAFTIYAPVIPIGAFVLRQGWFDGARFGSPGALVSFVDLVYDPLVSRADAQLPNLALFALGVPALLGAFYIFDRALPSLERPGPAFERLSRLMHNRLAMFGFGALVTTMTLSVSLSQTILVPLTLKGYVRRTQIIPYIMGANVLTWIDTLFASLLIDAPRAFTVVFTEMMVGAGVSLFVLLFAYGPYSRGVLALAHRATASRRGFAVFVTAILAVPAVLLLV